MLLLKIIESVAMAKATFVPVVQTENQELGFMFAKEWQLALAILSPVGMLLMWIGQQVWEMFRGNNKKIKEDLDMVVEAVTQIRAMVGEDLDNKIDRKIDRAFEHWERGRRHQ